MSQQIEWGWIVPANRNNVAVIAESREWSADKLGACLMVVTDGARIWSARVPMQIGG